MAFVPRLTPEAYANQFTQLHAASSQAAAQVTSASRDD